MTVHLSYSTNDSEKAVLFFSGERELWLFVIELKKQTSVRHEAALTVRRGLLSQPLSPQHV